MASLGQTPNVFAIPDPEGTGSVHIVTTPGTSQAAPSSSGSLTGTHFTVIGWIFFLILLYAANKTKLGHEAIFYSLALIVLFLFTANYKNIQKIMIKES